MIMFISSKALDAQIQNRLPEVQITLESITDFTGLKLNTSIKENCG
jgi:hypothetical protein